MFFPDYEEINDEFITKRRGSKSKESLPWSILNVDQTEEKIKIPSTPTAFVQYTTEELDQLDQPQHSRRKRQESEQYPTVPPLVYGITPQESLAGTDRESEKRDSPFLDQTVLKVGNRQDQFPTQIGEVTTPLTQFTQNIMVSLRLVHGPCELKCCERTPEDKTYDIYLTRGRVQGEGLRCGTTGSWDSGRDLG